MPQPPTVPTDVRADSLLAERYRLQGQRAEGPRSSLWRAKDEVLARSVALKVVPVRPKRRPRTDQASFAEINAAATAAGKLVDPRFVRVLDVVESGSLALIVSEWVDAPPLTNLLREGPLPPAQAADIAWQVAAALATAGRPHGQLHPRNVLVLPDGGVKITDFAVAAAVRGEATDDISAVGSLLYAGLTGAWTGPAGAGGGVSGPAEVGLPAAPSPDGRVRRPRQLRAAVPRETDQACIRLLEHATGSAPPLTVSAAADLLEALPRERPGTTPPPTAPPAPRAWRRWLGWAAAFVGLAIVGGTCWAIGTSVGRVPGGPQFPTYTTPRATPGAHTPTVLGPLLGKVRDFDPEGDHEEDPGEVDAAVDGQPRDDDTTSAWFTDRYKSPALGGLKSGVGLLVDLGRPTRVGAVHLVLTTPGAAVQVRAANSLGADAPDYTLVASSAHAAQQTTLTVRQPTTDRYWLVWFTRLPAVSGGYQEGVADLVFLS